MGSAHSSCLSPTLSGKDGKVGAVGSKLGVRLWSEIWREGHVQAPHGNCSVLPNYHRQSRCSGAKMRHFIVASPGQGDQLQAPPLQQKNIAISPI